MAHGRRPRRRARGRARAAGGARRCVREAALPRPGAVLRRLRGSGWRCVRQEDGGVPPVPCGEHRRRGDSAGDAGERALARQRRDRGHVHRDADAGRREWRPAGRRGVAHARVRQEPDDGVLRRADHPPPADGEPDDRRDHRPQRPRRPALRHVRALPRPAAAGAGAGRRRRRPAREALGRRRRRGVHDDPEVPARREGRPQPCALGAAQHRGDRRRGAPQPVRLHRRLRAPHARRAVAAHDVRRQADARARADAGDRARQPRVQGQAGRAGGGLPRPRRGAEGGAGDLHRERRHWPNRDRPGRGRDADAGEVRGVLRHLRSSHDACRRRGGGSISRAR